jgi:hypothetical protein
LLPARATDGFSHHGRPDLPLTRCEDVPEPKRFADLHSEDGLVSGEQTVGFDVRSFPRTGRGHRSDEARTRARVSIRSVEACPVRRAPSRESSPGRCCGRTFASAQCLTCCVLAAGSSFDALSRNDRLLDSQSTRTLDKRDSSPSLGSADLSVGLWDVDWCVPHLVQAPPRVEPVRQMTTLGLSRASSSPLVFGHPVPDGWRNSAVHPFAKPDACCSLGPLTSRSRRSKDRRARSHE